MSFMNPVDMVEEDAADLQFPKGASPHKRKKKCKAKVINALVNENTRYTVATYDPQQLQQYLEQQQELAEKSHSGSEDISQCATCRTKLQEPFIRCADCDEELCLQCFAKGREIRQHKNNHAYVIVKDDIQIFPGPGTWTARDERILLQTLETQGYGNWDAVAKALQYRHDAAACRQHYHDNYFGGVFEKLLGLQHASEAYTPQHTPYVVKMRSVDPPRHDDITSMQFKLMAGYRCARGDFDTPYDVTAESFLTAIQEEEERIIDTLDDEVKDECTEQCLDELKYALVQAYNHRLQERQRRYKVMRDHGLIMTNRTMGWITKYAEPLRSEANCKRFLAFMQLCKPMEFDLLMEGLKYFSDVQKAIFRLYELRQNGVRTMVGGSLYFKLKKKRLHEQRERLRNERQYHQYDWRKLIPSETPIFNEAIGSYFLTPTVNPLPRKKAGPMDVFGLPGFAKLNEDERQLCSVARIVPQSYLDYKNILITENAKVGHIRLADARRLIKIDVNKTRQIYDFLIEHGHINKPN
ncbi:transcriptional adapter 2A isoform X1 [Musca vetustissima]|uniref:transcriptional adapter 2A isoform X1 n=1 Tax=Musca vetustissima TaxID=27455 RepID=UPI002AB64A45|nr:transcriptional adapter 2A isoform X1 [Musca vetustissima]